MGRFYCVRYTKTILHNWHKGKSRFLSFSSVQGKDKFPSGPWKQLNKKDAGPGLKLLAKSESPRDSLGQKRTVFKESCLSGPGGPVLIMNTALYEPDDSRKNHMSETLTSLTYIHIYSPGYCQFISVMSA